MKLVFFIALVLVVSSVHAGMPNRLACGIYALAGKLYIPEKFSGECWLDLWPNSQSELRVILEKCPSAFSNYNRAFIRVKVNISVASGSDIRGESLEKVPLRSLPVTGFAAARPIHKGSCLKGAQ